MLWTRLLPRRVPKAQVVPLWKMLGERVQTNMNMGLWAEENPMYKVLAGSRLYGTDRPDSDYDYRGVCFMPREALLGLLNFEQYQVTKGKDVVVYGVTKFFRLAEKVNPNILDILFAPKSAWLFHTSEWDLVFNNRHLFLSQKVRHTFSGYAVSQLHRIKKHRKWLQFKEPPPKPQLEDYGGKLITKKRGGQKLFFRSRESEVSYQEALRQHRQYQQWKLERNPARAELETKFGYDTRHAGHLVRLLLQARNVLIEGDYNPVLRSDSDLIVAQTVLNGEWAYDTLIQWAVDAERLVQEVHSELPKKPNHKAIEELLITINGRGLYR